MSTIQTTQSTIKKTEKQNCIDKDKKIVIHGLPEYYDETEEDTENRILDIFYDILKVNLNGYIEKTTRLGRGGRYKFNRPLVVELISKKMTNYILKNAQYLKCTELTITEYLDEDSLKERKILKEQLMTARQNGSHAIIRNNKLIINGKYTMQQVPLQQNSNESRKDNETNNHTKTLKSTTRHTQMINNNNSFRNSNFRKTIF